MSLFFFQCKQAYLSLKQKPGFVFSVVTTMGVTLGALLCVLTLAYVMLLKPLPYPEQDKLYSVKHNYISADNNIDAIGFSYPNLINLYKNQTVFSDAALVGYFENIITSSALEPVSRTTFVTPKWFSLLDASMALGRSFEATEVLDSNNPVAVLSYDIWVNMFAKSANVLAEKVTIRGVTFKIVGVLAKSFIEPKIHGVDLQTDIWLPWDFNNDYRQRNHWSGIGVNLAFVGKLIAGITPEQAEQKISMLVNDTWRTHVSNIAFFNGFSIKLQLHSFHSAIVGDSPKTIWLLVAGCLALVILAFSNIVNLFISRSAEQQQVLTIQAALGAKKSDLLKKLFTEITLLMTVSVVLAVMVSQLFFLILKQTMALLLPRVAELSINEFTLIIAIVLLLLFAAILTFITHKLINYSSLNLTLQSSGKGGGLQVSKHLSMLIITSQIAIASTLVFVNLNLYKEAVNIINTPMGFNLDNTHYLSVAISSANHPDRKKHAAMMADFRNKILSLPQVQAISQSSSPLSIFGINALTNVKTNEKFSMPMKSIDHEYFTLIEQPLLSGNFFTPAHIKDQSMVIIINDVLANNIANVNDAIGMQLALGSDGDATVIGVVKGVKLPGETSIPMRFYDSVPSDLSVIIKLKASQTLSRQTIATLLKTVSNQYSIFRYEDLNKIHQQQLFTQKFTLYTTATLTLITLLLTIIGLYGILSYSTQMRRFEIGTRLAIGAKRGDVIKLIITDNVKAILVGIGISTLVLLALSLGFSEQLNDYLTWQLLPLFILTLVFIGVISFAACYLPLRQYINKPVQYSLRGAQ